MVEVFFTHRTFRNIVFTDEAEIPRALRVFSTGDFLWCLQWGIRADFRNMDSIFRLTTYRWSMELIFWGSVVPKSTNDWWNMSFQLPRFAKIRVLKYFRFNWKLHCKLRSRFERLMGILLITPNFDLVWKSGTSSGHMGAKSYSHHGTAMRSQNLERFPALLSLERGWWPAPQMHPKCPGCMGFRAYFAEVDHIPRLQYTGNHWEISNKTAE